MPHETFDSHLDFSDKNQPAVFDPLSDGNEHNEHNEQDMSPSLIHESTEDMVPTSSFARLDVGVSDYTDPLDEPTTAAHDDNLGDTNAFYYHNNLNNDEPSTSAALSSSSASSAPLASPAPSFSWRNITVADPRKENDPQHGIFVSYLISSTKSSVRRRFQDFVWLYNVLYVHYPACVIPPLPDRHRSEYVKGNRFSPEFIEKRRISLQRFLQRVARHPILHRVEYFTMFLESSEFNDASARALRKNQETMIDTIGDSLLNAFTKIKKRDERFVGMKERVDRLEENLSLVEKTQLRANKRMEDLHHDYADISKGLKGLAELDPGYSDMLNCFTHGVDKYAEHMKSMNEQDDAWAGEIHDYMAYNSAMKAVLKLRDQKQLDFEELSDYLQATVAEKEKVLHPHLAENGGYNITGYFTGKLNEARGADADKIKREKILRLDDRIHELREAIEQTHEVSTAFSDQVRREDDSLNASKAIEMHDALRSLTDAKVEFYQQGAHIWRDVVKALESADIDG